MKPLEFIESIESKKDFIKYVKKLRDDKIDENKKEKLNPSSPYSQGQNGWENGTKVAFLDVIAAYGERTFDKDDNPSGKSFAELLQAGKFYE